MKNGKKLHKVKLLFLLLIINVVYAAHSLSHPIEINDL